MKLILRLIHIANLSLLLTLTACKGSGDKASDQIVARVNDINLYKVDLEELVPTGTHPKDSQLIIDRYIQQWVNEQYLAQVAEDELSDKEKNFTDQIDRFRKSLLRAAFEEKILADLNEESLTQEELDSFYTANTYLFPLQTDIIRCRLIRVPNNAPKMDWLIRTLKTNNKKELKSLEDYCFRYAEFSSFQDSDWVSTDIALKTVPATKKSSIGPHNRSQVLVLEDSLGRNVIWNRDYKSQGDPSPFEFEETKIRKLLLLHRKQQYLEKHYATLIEKALRKKQIEIFTQK